MSFSGTPLGQGRRLDHYSFLNKPKPKSLQKEPNEPPKQSHLIPTSYAYGAPSSPPQLSKSLSRESHLGPEEDDSSEPALVRFARLKERESTSAGPRVINTAPNPEKWTVRDTTVNVATAFHQAAASDMPPVAHDPNASWAQGRTKTNLPRSTSVEYEKETQSTTSRRLAAPPSRLAPPRPVQPPRRPISKQQSIRHVPASEGEDEEVSLNGRAKSPFEQAVDFTKRALAPATFYLRQRSQEPQDISHDSQNRTNGDSSHSYDYSAEEHEFQNQTNGNGVQKPTSASTRRAQQTHRKNRMSTDNKAYRPSHSDLEVSDDDVSDEGKRRRRKKKKKEPVGGPLTTLPVTSYDKRRKKKGGKTGGDDDVDEDESEESGSEEMVAAQQRIMPSVRPPSSRASAHGDPVSPNAEPHDSGFVDTSMDIEQGLDSIPEQDEYPPELDDSHYSDAPVRSGFSVGALLGKLVYLVTRSLKGALHFVLRLVGLVAILVGRIIGTVIDVLFRQPFRLLSHANTAGLMKLFAYVVVAALVYALWRNASLLSWPSSRQRQPFKAPGIPAADIAELSTRLQTIENVLSGLSLDYERAQAKLDSESRMQTELVGRFGDMESRMQKESARMLEAENQFRSTASKGLQAVREEILALQAQIEEKAGMAVPTGPSTDEEARAKLKEIEERLGGVEGGVKEALESAKSSIKVQGPNGAAGWWNKLASGTGTRSSLVIKSSDGQDVTSLLADMVDTAVSRFSKDIIALPDFAMYSAGASVIPSLTSDTYELKPPNGIGKLVGWVTGHGYAMGPPPVTALHHELHAGRCWPFAGSQGQLGVMLAYPVYISHVTIDHVAKEVAFDMASAPRDMELWGMIDGMDNVRKIREWQAEKARRREELRLEAEAQGMPPPEDDEPVYPPTLEKDRYIRVASFAYDINASNHIQTFPVSPDIRDLGVDFGVVVLMVKDNWGMDDYTCLYRLRVHGDKLGANTPPHSHDEV
ncbi:hypothetical protein NEOLEDRAFT_1098422 [Neolentinus lepideus HHB14362 ss-1]|uniref:SUN domain-containing protein n=1 Tax=Neolentinus lepideus HHB14362 ss-1 TaxID=1314782 RepID=A0A165Q7K6_9AGAM|nr:hypothetical protein NEOLEDRAFT_1098422 [Neolentinus lepideus HHB14362 ss-1]